MLKGLLRTMGCLRRDPRMTRRVLKQLPIDLRGVDYARAYDGSAAAFGLAPAAPAPLERNRLREFFEGRKASGGRGVWKWRHYFDIYHRHFSKFVGKEVRILEIGVYSGGSMEMWREYFGPRCRVYGVDIEEACKSYENEWTKVFIGDQADRAFWARVRREAPEVDIVVDDGGHQPEQQIVTLEEMLPHLRPGGVFLCEDVTTDGGLSDFQAFVHRLEDNLQTLDFAPECRPKEGMLVCTPTGLQRAVHSIHVYPYVTVIEKHERPVEEFRAPKHGTEWQPYSGGT